jgi:hypothetical protein
VGRTKGAEASQQDRLYRELPEGSNRIGLELAGLQADQMSEAPQRSKYHFTLEGSGLGETTWRVAGPGELTRLRVRYEATAYQRSIANYTHEEWERDVVGAINLLVDANGGREVPQDLVDAFNAWRLDSYTRHRQQIDTQPERYGVVDWDKDTVFRNPPTVRGARYIVRWNRPGPDQWKHGCVGLGWQVNPHRPQNRTAKPECPQSREKTPKP